MKLFVTILTVMAVGFVGLVATIFASLSRNAEFYSAFVPAVTVGIIITIILAIYGKLKEKIPKVSMLIFAILAVLSVSAFEGYQAYLHSLEVVSSQDVDLSEYRPFIDGSKAVRLDEDSTFKIEDNLPSLDGATALYPVYAAFAQAVYPEKEYDLYNSEVVSSQTSHAFDRLVKGEVDIVFMAHPSEKQMKGAERNGVELSLTPIGREAFVFFVHNNNSVEELTVEQIQRIYSGKITNWKEVGGTDEEIRAFQRPEGSGSQSALISVMDGIPLMDAPSEDIVSAMGGIIKETTNYRNRTNAIGFSFRHFSQEMVHDGKIKNIAVEGVLPTKENIQNESYPIVDQFYAITAGSENPHVEAFIKWMQSDQGQKIVDLTGYVPLTE
ncbi:phosphate transport system substrate-binding protein [Mesobacillus persicus]|uniref:Phosphate transport system substrate-binding protein n=1 Tax=Mesobacillus persicus TaxID=930146 RepID=A0A1H8IUZ7_9BACI|nr:substrate-binding domain-containing protein [Mesobacillus persicus]SEN71787.1 phosphate transport system substrate-binding protein [Mesobacillus persicus]